MMCNDSDRWFVIGQAFGVNWACGNNTSVFSRSSAFTEFIDGIRTRVEGMFVCFFNRSLRAETHLGSETRERVVMIFLRLLFS